MFIFTADCFAVRTDYGCMFLDKGGKSSKCFLEFTGKFFPVLPLTILLLIFTVDVHPI
jgi:hypothetical protein